MVAHGFGVFVLHHAKQNVRIGFAQLCRFGQGAENTDVTQRQLRLCNNLEANEVVLAMPRRLVRLSIPPTPTEYDLLFGRGRR